MSRLKLDSWEKALAEAMGAQAETVPKGWITVRTFAEKILNGTPISTAQKKMRLLMNAGKAESKTYRIKTELKIVAVPHYRLKK